MQKSIVYNSDCVLGMKEFPDHFFDLAIADPPFGIGKYWMKDISTYKYGKKEWNNSIPTQEYFDQLFRISKHQIIFGGNYYTEFLSPTNGWIIWDKGVPAEVNFSQAVMAWTSLKISTRLIKYQWSGALCNGRVGFHPCEMPVPIYTWILKQFAKPGYKIIDTHMGSQSSRIASYHAGLDYWGWELDEEYFKKGNERFKFEKKKQFIF